MEKMLKMFKAVEFFPWRPFVCSHSCLPVMPVIAYCKKRKRKERRQENQSDQRRKNIIRMEEYNKKAHATK